MVLSAGGLSYTVTFQDIGLDIYGGSLSTVLVNANIAPVGMIFYVSQAYNTTVQITGGPGVTIVGLNGTATRGQYDRREVQQIDTNIWRVL